MYYSLEGQITEKSPAYLILNVNGVCYDIQISLSTFSGLGALGERAHVFTHFVVREDAHCLYGFTTLEERDLFRMLISVSGIGPKVGLMALSGIPIRELKNALVTGSIPLLTSIPGIGKKTAERMIVELKEKVVIESPASDIAGALAGTPGQRRMDDALQALVSLGYRKNQAKTALEKVVKDIEDMDLAVEDLIRASLKQL